MLQKSVQELLASNLRSNNIVPSDVLLLCGIPNHMHAVDLSVPAAMLAALVSLIPPDFHLAVAALDICLASNTDFRHLRRVCLCH